MIRKTKTGPSTDESVLSELAAQGHEIPRLILEYRELDKLDGPYVSKLPSLVNPETGRIHTTFNQTVAATGRLSSSDPNLQNIPVRTSLGREIRKGFVPAEGYVFVSADYSQIELRVLAHLSHDPAFVAAFQSDRDIHRETAARIFGVAPEAVSAGMRDQAKTINFATIYGQGPVALAVHRVHVPGGPFRARLGRLEGVRHTASARSGRGGLTCVSWSSTRSCPGRRPRASASGRGR